MTILVLAGDAGAAPYLKVEGESMTDSTTTTEDFSSSGFSGTGYTIFQRDGTAYSWAKAKNAGWLRIRARSNGCQDGTYAHMNVLVGNAGTVFDQELTGNWTWYTTPAFVVDQTGTGSAYTIVAVTQYGGTGACTKQVRLDDIEFYVWRPFSPDSLWNQTADGIASAPGTKTGIQSGTGAWLAPGQSGLDVGGCPPGSGCMQDRPFNKPICFGESDQSGASSATGPAQSLVKGNIAYTGQPIRLASPCGAATGSDGGPTTKCLALKTNGQGPCSPTNNTQCQYRGYVGTPALTCEATDAGPECVAKLANGANCTYSFECTSGLCNQYANSLNQPACAAAAPGLTS